ncbi:MAG TPA: hypothetical protein VGG33_15045 [Polyangia bacterium]
MNQVVNQVWWMLRAVFGVIPVVAGLDKFFNLLTPWEQYLSPLALRLSPVSAPALMRVFGIVEIAVGVMILTRWTRIGAYVASAWLLLIALNLLTMGRFLDVAARDVALAVTAFGLARLQEARTTAPAARRGAGVPRPVHG